MGEEVNHRNILPLKKCACAVYLDLAVHVQRDGVRGKVSRETWRDHGVGQ